MSRRWRMLAALFVARTAMGFQFQSVAVCGPLLVRSLDISYANLGTLVGLYLLPGIAVSLPGGWLGSRWGEKPVVLSGLVLMTAGGLLTALAATYAVALSGRVVAGAGAVLLNVLLSKMTADWFAERGLATAMGILLSAWPLGIALSLLLLGPLAVAAGWPLAIAATAAAASVGLVAVALVYRAPSETSETAAGEATIDRQEILLAILAGLVWTFYNVGLIVVLAFGTEFLTSLGNSIASAAAITSIVGWVIIPAVPLGAYLAERFGRPDTTMIACFLLTGALITGLAAGAPPVLVLPAIGLLFGPPAGLIMALPASVLRPRSLSIGLGIYFTCYYAGMGTFPAAAGWLRDMTGAPAAPILLAALTAASAAVALTLFRLAQGRLAIASRSGLSSR